MDRKYSRWTITCLQEGGDTTVYTTIEKETKKEVMNTIDWWTQQGSLTEITITPTHREIPSK